MKKILICTAILVLFHASAYARVPEGNLLDGVEPGPDGRIDVLTIFAHQDDESIFGGGAILLMMRDPRVRLHILCLTLGDKSGAYINLGITQEHLGRIRVKELETAAAVYGAEHVYQLDYHDQELSDANQEELIYRITVLMKHLGIEIVITHDPTGVTRHPDHITCSRVATEAFRRSDAKRLYYPTVFRPLNRLVGKFSPMNFDPGTIKAPYPTMRVDIKEVKKLKKMAFFAHASQKHFSSVGFIAKFVFIFDHEFYVLAGEK